MGHEASRCRPGSSVASWCSLIRIGSRDAVELPEARSTFPDPVDISLPEIKDFPSGCGLGCPHSDGKYPRR